MADHHNQNTPPETPPQNTTEAIVSVDPYRPPQLNGDNSSNRCNCPCARGVSEDDRDTIVVESGQETPSRGANDPIDQYEIIDSASLYEDDAMGGDEGVEPHLCFEEGPFSPFPSPDEAYSSLECSMFVEPGSREISMESSLATLPSRNSSVYRLTGAWADSGFVSTPLRLTPEVVYCYPLEIVLS